VNVAQPRHGETGASIRALVSASNAGLGMAPGMQGLQVIATV
jgi:hypothetical protein